MMNHHVTKGSVLNDLGVSEAETHKLKIRAALIDILAKEIKARYSTHVQAAKALRISQARVSYIKHRRACEFTIDRLVTFLAKMQIKVDFVVDDKLV